MTTTYRAASVEDARALSVGIIAVRWSVQAPSMPFAVLSAARTRGGSVRLPMFALQVSVAAISRHLSGRGPGVCRFCPEPLPGRLFAHAEYRADQLPRDAVVAGCGDEADDLYLDSLMFLVGFAELRQDLVLSC